MKKFDVITLRLVFAFCVVLLCFMGAIIFFTFYPFKIIEFKQNPIRVDQKQNIYPGDYVPVHWQFRKYTDTPAQVLVTLVNGRQIILDEIWTAKLPGDYDYIGSQVQIPKNFITPGWWHIKFQFIYRVNYLRDEVVHISTEKFQIKEKPGEKVVCPPVVKPQSKAPPVKAPPVEKKKGLF